VQQVQSNFTFLEDTKIITLCIVINLINMMIKKFCIRMCVCLRCDVGMVKFRSALHVEHAGSALAKIFWLEALRHHPYCDGREVV
jgi:hypothetical protein